MKALFVILSIMLSIIVMPAHAQSTSEFGYQLHPEKLLENTEATLQIFVTSNDLMVPKQIQNLNVISSDNDIIQILRVEEGNDLFTKNVIVKANEPGIVNIALAASGFTSKEIALEVFTNNNYPTQMLMKVTPKEFPVDGPRFGHIALELATTGGLPTITTEDVTIHLTTPNEDVIKIKDPELTISNGEYFAITQFEILDYGDAIIFAETENMKKISSIVNVLEATTPLELQLYIYPENFVSFSGSEGYAIVQLLDGDGIPVFAEEDIHLELQVENPDASINTSHDFEEVTFDQKDLVIEKGSYSTFTKFSPRPNLGEFTSEIEQTYEMFISADNFLTTGSTFTVLHDEIGALEGKGPSVTQVLPFLTTGKQEIIGVTYYETEIEVSRQVGGSTEGATNRELVTVTVPVLAQENHKISISSSEEDSVNPIDPQMKRGESAVLLLAETGTIAPENPVSFYITDNQGVKQVTGEPVGPLESELKLIIDPLIPIILAEHEFPVLGYMSDGVEEEETEGEESAVEEGESAVEEGESEETDADPRLGVSYFISDEVLSFSANEIVNVDSVSIKRNQPYAEFNMMSNELGKTNVVFQMGGFSGTTEITSHTADPASIHLSYPKNILANSETLATVQVLDSVENPVYAKKDINIKLVSNDNTILQVPDELIIKEGDYFSKFELKTLDEGSVELALLSEDFSLSKHDINIIDISPVLAMDFIGGLGWNERLEAKVSVTIPQVVTSLNGFNVEWDINGGEILTLDEITNNDGIAIANILANDKEKISITAKVSGNGLSSTTITETATILNMPVVEEIGEEVKTESSVGLPIDNTMMILIIIPIAIGAGLFFLKRTDRLDLITEKIPIGDKIEEIKEKISDIRNR